MVGGLVESTNAQGNSVVQAQRAFAEGERAPGTELSTHLVGECLFRGHRRPQRQGRGSLSKDRMGQSTNMQRSVVKPPRA